MCVKITQSVSRGNLPQLDFLLMRHNNLCEVEDAVEGLLEVCYTHCRENTIPRSIKHDGYSLFNLSGNKLSSTTVNNKLSERVKGSQENKAHVAERVWGYELYFLNDSGDVEWCFAVEI